MQSRGINFQKIAMRQASRMLAVTVIEQISVCLCKGRDVGAPFFRGNRLMSMTCCYALSTAVVALINILKMLWT